MIRSLFFVAIVLLVFTISACQPNPSHNAADDHEHGPNTHTHDEPIVADTAGTYVDSTSAFFDEDEHEHGEDTHTHDDDAPGHQ